MGKFCHRQHRPRSKHPGSRAVAARTAMTEVFHYTSQFQVPHPLQTDQTVGQQEKSSGLLPLSLRLWWLSFKWSE